MCGHSKRENREVSLVSSGNERRCCSPLERSANVTDEKAGMNAQENSDESIVPAKSANNGGPEPAAESIEQRGSAKRNAVPADLLRTQNRDNCKSSG